MQKLNQKLARSELQSSLESAPKHGEGLAKGIKNIENGIKKCLKQKIMSSDNQIVVAKSKLEHLRIKNGKKRERERKRLRFLQKKSDNIERAKCKCFN